MLDLKFLRENPEIVKQNIRNKFQDAKLPLVDEVIALDEELRQNKKRADVSLWLYDTEKLHDELATAEEAMKHATFDLQMAEDAIQSLETQNAKLFEASQSSKKESEELLTQIREQTELCHTLDRGNRGFEFMGNTADEVFLKVSSFAK